MQDRTLGEALGHIQKDFMKDILENKVKTERIKCRYCIRANRAVEASELQGTGKAKIT